MQLLQQGDYSPELKCAEYISENCDKASADDRVWALRRRAQGKAKGEVENSQSNADENSESTSVKKRKFENTELSAFLEKPLDPMVADDIDKYLLR